MSLQLSNFTLH